MGVDKINYAKVLAALEEETSVYRELGQRPHPWEQEYRGYFPGPVEVQRLGRSRKDHLWDPFPHRWRSINPLVLYTRIIRGEERIASLGGRSYLHPLGCGKCDAIREARREFLGNRL